MSNPSNQPQKLEDMLAALRSVDAVMPSLVSSIRSLADRIQERRGQFSSPEAADEGASKLHRITLACESLQAASARLAQAIATQSGKAGKGPHERI